MQSKLSHLQFNVAAENLPFYRDLFGFLGWQTYFDEPEMYGAACESGESVWFAAGAKAVANDYDGPGLNHLGLAAESIADVDAAARYLKDKDIAHLFETPRHRPEFSEGDNTYYQVMFESPDRILFEFVYIGPKV